ncbi:MAG: adenine-specific methyltransferase EcoRI family protein [Bacteroidales bacterium]|nr:adenine-specific methyltransferase EcoRI family protein [Bacteroidales bacterium]
MARNSNLGAAKAAKNDEFYTQYNDIQKEINSYLEFNPNVFKGKTLLLPCDDPEWSNFTKFFAQNFELLGLKKLISTSFAQDSKNYKSDWNPTLFETENPIYDATKSAVCGKIFVIDRDINGDGRINIKDIEWEYLEGTGDYRSEEVTKLRDEADIIVTNPPFSLFREFMAWLVESDKQFSIIGNMNAITYKEVFPLFKENKIWLGPSISSGDREFGVPDWYPLEAAGWRIDENPFYENGKKKPYTKYIRVKGVRWFTNIEHGRRHEPLSLLTMAQNIRFSKHKEIKGKEYLRYDNYDAIEVPFTDAIPSDYEEMMGVPISFIDKYCPEQFEIIGMAKRGAGDPSLRSKVYTKSDYPNYGDLNATPTLFDESGKLYNTYPRILIRKKQQ